jgi:diadenylate cyclase
MKNFFQNIVLSIGITDVIDILIVAFVVYKILGFIRETRAEQLVKGLLILVIATFLAGQLNFYTMSWILNGTLTLGVIALVIVFQPELRRGLEYVGRSKIVKSPFGQFDKEKAKLIVSSITRVIDEFSKTKTGALIVVERETALNDVAETGTKLDALISSEMLGNIFYVGAPLHDGAVIIRGERVLAAGCVLPLTQNNSLSSDLGTRHRAALGITENSDAIVLVVSEETGIISLADNGKLNRFLDIKSVEKILLNLYLNGATDDNIASFMSKLGRKK